MPCILALDVGGKRTGMAVSDEGQVFAFPLETVPSNEIITRIQELRKSRSIAEIVLGMPVNLRNEATDGTKMAVRVLALLRREFSDLAIFTIDERFTSRMAKAALIEGGMKKTDRRQKENTDKVSAALILQSYIEQKSRFGSFQTGKDYPHGV
jgi:putative Holliday junction resolvase